MTADSLTSLFPPAPYCIVLVVAIPWQSQVSISHTSLNGSELGGNPPWDPIALS